MKGRLLVYVGMAIIAFERFVGSCCFRLGESLKRLGRKLCSLRKDDARWSTEMFLRCFMVDAEFHIGLSVYRGPLSFAHRTFRSGDDIVFELNWTAERTLFSGWQYSGTSQFRIRDARAPVTLPGGDIWFGFPGGHGIIFFGKGRLSLPSDAEVLLRKYTYF